MPLSGEGSSLHLLIRLAQPLLTGANWGAFCRSVRLLLARRARSRRRAAVLGSAASWLEAASIPDSSACSRGGLSVWRWWRREGAAREHPVQISYSCSPSTLCGPTTSRRLRWPRRVDPRSRRVGAGEPRFRGGLRALLLYGPLSQHPPDRALSRGEWDLHQRAPLGLRHSHHWLGAAEQGLADRGSCEQLRLACRWRSGAGLRRLRRALSRNRGSAKATGANRARHDDRRAGAPRSAAGRRSTDLLVGPLPGSPRPLHAPGCPAGASAGAHTPGAGRPQGAPDWPAGVVRYPNLPVSRVTSRRRLLSRWLRRRGAAHRQRDRPLPARAANAYPATRP